MSVMCNDDIEEEYADVSKASALASVKNDPMQGNKKPVPVPRHTGTSNIPTEELGLVSHRDPEDKQTITKPPGLPPRRFLRPRSPWHDIPTNNSPVYGNLDDLHSASMRQEITDEMLGTPQGFTFVKNKWRAAEKGSSQAQWNRELRQVAFPGRLGQRVLQWQGETSGGEDDKHETSMCSERDKNLTKSPDYQETLKARGKEEGSLVPSGEERNRPALESKKELHTTCHPAVHIEKTQTVVKSTDTSGSFVFVECEDTSKLPLNIERKTNESHIEQNEIPGMELIEKQGKNISGTHINEIEDKVKVNKCIKYEETGHVEQEQLITVTKRYSDELNLLLAQLAEITSAPLLSPGVTISLVDFPENRKQRDSELSEFDQLALQAPIRRRRHSDPDYDVPRPHRSLLHLLPRSGGTSVKLAQEGDVIQATRFFGETDLNVESLAPRLTQLFGTVDHSRNSWNTTSMSPDSLETEHISYTAQR
uniref:Uncharacterized protein n=1 Tax=Timema shepardi TaxID=629360 RepID=A0A7R9AR06_TIMSH|nr:unnamed protein product [Timema shepardi]